MDTVNVTVTLPKSLMIAARHQAVDNGMSLSKFVAAILAERVETGARYERAMADHLELMEEKLPLGLNDQIEWARESLHER